MELFLALLPLMLLVGIILLIWGAYEKGYKEGWEDREAVYLSPRSIRSILDQAKPQGIYDQTKDW